VRAGTAPESVWRFTPPATGTICVDTAGSTYDTVLFARSNCTGTTDLACNDDTPGVGTTSRIQLNVTGGTDVFFFIDGFGTAGGSYRLNIASGACAGAVTETNCTDRVDNDRDGAADCADTDCAANPACAGIETNCTDTVDNDADGAADCADTDCLRNPACIPQPENCTDTRDNDLDGAVDCADTDCATNAACVVFEICDDGIDNDGDGAIDCDDPECVAAPGCVTAGQTCDDPNVATTYGRYSGLTAGLVNNAVPSCSRGSSAPESVWRFTPPATGTVCVDTTGSTYDTVLFARSNCTGTTDLACNDDTPGVGTTSRIQLNVTAGTDVFFFIDGFGAAGGSYRLNITSGACAGTTAETNCTDRIDNDRDGAADCADSDCATNPACARVETNCTDGLDNDRDGAADCGDRDCAANPACLRVETNCADGLDNDRDGAADCGDRDCAADPACLVSPEICDNGFDDDANGLTDCQDFTCAADPACAGVESCFDGLDNDGNGLTDCEDPVCFGTPFCPVSEICDNGFDDDGNTLVDCDDPACAADPVCVSTAVGTCDTPLRLNPFGANNGNTSEGAAVLDATCGGDASNEQVWSLGFAVPFAVTACVTVSGSSFTPVLYAYSGACAPGTPDVACDVGTPGSSSLEVRLTPGQQFYLVVDSADGGAGSYSLRASIGACP
jgi:hypothetical protein